MHWTVCVICAHMMYCDVLLHCNALDVHGYYVVCYCICLLIDLLVHVFVV